MNRQILLQAELHSEFHDRGCLTGSRRPDKHDDLPMPSNFAGFWIDSQTGFNLVQYGFGRRSGRGRSRTVYVAENRLVLRHFRLSCGSDQVAREFLREVEGQQARKEMIDNGCLSRSIPTALEPFRNGLTDGLELL